MLGGRWVPATLVRCLWPSLFAVMFGGRLAYAMLFGGQLIFAVPFGGRRFLSRPALDDGRAFRNRRGALHSDAMYSDAMTNEWLGLRAVVNPTVPIVRVPVVIHVVNRAPFVIVLGRDVDIDRRGGRVDVHGLRVGFGVAGGWNHRQSSENQGARNQGKTRYFGHRFRLSKCHAVLSKCRAVRCGVALEARMA